MWSGACASKGKRRCRVCGGVVRMYIFVTRESRVALLCTRKREYPDGSMNNPA